MCSSGRKAVSVAMGTARAVPMRGSRIGMQTRERHSRGCSDEMLVVCSIILCSIPSCHSFDQANLSCSRVSRLTINGKQSSRQQIE